MQGTLQNCHMFMHLTLQALLKGARHVFGMFLIRLLNPEAAGVSLIINLAGGHQAFQNRQVRSGLYSFSSSENMGHKGLLAKDSLA